jgi:hypothetical protein
MAEIRVGKARVAPDTAAHTRGVRQGNAKNAYKHMSGHHPDGTADARRSTGIDPKKHDAILAVMPNVPPA